MKSLDDQIKCAKRELALRQRCYPKWVERGTMRQATADHELECMESIVASLEAYDDAREDARDRDTRT